MKYLLLFLLFLIPPLKSEEAKLIICEKREEFIDYTIEMIEKAQQSIEFSSCFSGGALFQNYLDRIERQMKKHRSLQVYFLLSATHFEKEDADLLLRLEKEYKRQFHLVRSGSVVDFSQDLNLIDNHIKVLIVDERYFTIGSTKYDESISCDQDIIGKSPIIAKEMRQKFHTLFAFWTDFEKKKRFTSKNPLFYEEKSAYKEINPYKRPFVKRFEEASTPLIVDTSEIKLLAGGPFSKPNPITEEYCRLIERAEKEILIGNLHFYPTSPIFDALKNAANRGVEITILTNGMNRSSPLCTTHFCWANRINYLPILMGRSYLIWEKKKCEGDLPQKGHIYEYFAKQCLYRKKIMLVDQKELLIGSYNLGTRSATEDFEMVIVIDSPKLAAEAVERYRKDLLKSIEITPKEMRDWYFDPLISYKAEVQKTFHAFF
ncbi:MAG: Cardiolipin synthase [Chlamydiales bacterium]|nr:Cardiolipin synthase [Chlamydiales bacterium]MCH9619973.1 Cardiolipin synthase [Chlamydiales bacterium]MCH9622600.1 Cardiolipin synthase [Chlamydiales bacterium]